MKKSLKFLVICVAVFIFGSSFVSASPEAAVKILDWSLVKGKDLHWRNNSKYTTQLNQAVSTWNGYRSGTIKTFTSSNTDVVISDYSENSSVAGVTSPQRTIKLNKKQMDTYTAAQKRNVTTHEFGHALGLNHSTTGNVLYAYVSSVTKLGQSDKDSLNSAVKTNWK